MVQQRLTLSILLLLVVVTTIICSVFMFDIVDATTSYQDFEGSITFQDDIIDDDDDSSFQDYDGDSLSPFSSSSSIFDDSDDTNGSSGGGNTYNCNVDSTIPSNCTSFVKDSNIKTDALINCTYISDCIAVVQNMSLTKTDTLNINLADPLYNGSGNCNLYFDTPAQIFISPMGTPVIVDCIGQASFITHARANLVLSNVYIKNAYSSCVTIQQNPTSFTVFVYNSVFENCTSPGNGGGIQASYPNSIIVHDSTFSNNHAIQGGAISGFTVFLYNSMFVGNSATKGGAVYTDSTMTSAFIRSENCTFKSNNAHLGGAAFVYDLKSINSIYSNNFAQMGGAVFTQSIDTTQSRFLQNSAVNGGAIALAGSPSKNSISLSFIYNNTALEDGGAMYIISPTAPGNLNLQHSKIFNNQASGCGGAVYFNQTNSSYLLGGFFSDNYSPDNEEIACDDSSQPYNCNPCQANQCEDCLQMAGAICITQDFTSYCYIATESCIFGNCSIGNSSNVSCDCSSGYQGDTCATPITPPPHHGGGHNSALAFEISMPIVFGSLVILFLIVIFIMIKKRNNENSYQPLVNS
ncbi:hypothetical protein DFA_05735 [Cavenderia fasciculata]|uniref:EGF-like domain-containing protein n=1 Tax=Cavenderia fasciculata TaxID=261658 RepID=F4PMA1_CACFS|nr:uncharacterized protein DFA_05735 [Cavenderia fasciculata]EGG23601.1 hypothetical protein DFA_05735 [Cavenderia fasciculata]|eukprot:XP_004361452.1 hypothetical protein DFA_05735 [Cavenderia fasciculata]